ncbi:hypothetical protein D7V93_37495 [Corallococcus llansteffanensis]|uniref:Uncharacterized protein n=1 Tax=Corallococcus llansteffanensis TaxID=2316731 RepID=A0A3A8NGW7_9BACT|nr:hypothetical protein D7V93_37495 [Corallococcus llansteffanensis]
MLAGLSAGAAEPVGASTEQLAQDFVSSLDRAVQVPSRPGLSDAQARPANTYQTFYFANFTGAVVYNNGTALTGVSIVTPLPAAMASSPSGFVGSAQAVVPASTPWSQVITYTTNLSDPYGAAKTCTYSVSTAFVNGACQANITFTAQGAQGAVCGFFPAQSGVDPVTCQLQLAVGIQ